MLWILVENRKIFCTLYLLLEIDFKPYLKFFLLNNVYLLWAQFIGLVSMAFGNARLNLREGCIQFRF